MSKYTKLKKFTIKKLLYIICVLFFSVSISVHSQNTFLKLQIESDSTSQQIKETYPDISTALQELEKIKLRYQKKGFPFLKTETNQKKDSLFSKIILGQKFSKIGIQVSRSFQNYIPKEYLVNSTFDTLNLNFEELDSFINKVIQKSKSSGRPFINVKLKEISRLNRNTISAKLQIESKNSRTIDKINIKGYDKFPKSFVKYQANLRQGQIFDENQIQRKTQKLNSVAFIEIQKPTEVLFKKDSTEIFVYVKKRENNSFDGFLGFGNSENNDFEVNGYVNLKLSNNLNFGEDLMIVYKNDGNDLQRFEADTKLPFIFKSPISLGVGLRIFRSDSLFSNTTQKIRADYRINEKLAIFSKANFTKSTELDDNSSGIGNINNEIESFSSNFYGIGAEYEQARSNTVFSETTFANLGFNLGARQTNETTEQYIIELEVRHQFQINQRQRIQANLFGNYLFSDNYLNNELYRFGGLNSIRGFEENRLIASKFTTLQTEYRYILDSNIYVNSVLDIGYYENELDEISDNILGFGVGLGLNTKAGVLKLIIANSVAKNKEVNASNSKIHISLTSYF